MYLIENAETNEVYARKGTKLQLQRGNHVFCRNEKGMLLSKTEHLEQNSFCEVNGLSYFVP